MTKYLDYMYEKINEIYEPYAESYNNAPFEEDEKKEIYKRILLVFFCETFAELYDDLDKHEYYFKVKEIASTVESMLCIKKFKPKVDDGE